MTPVLATRRFLLPLTLAALAACEGTSGDAIVSAPRAAAAPTHGHIMTQIDGTKLTGPQQAWIAQLRRESRRWQDAARVTDIWETELACMVDETTGLGGMGIHRLDTDRLGAPVDPLTPEALMYEPQPDGSRKLVGVEFVKARGATVPEIAGIPFHLHPNGQLYILHVWIAEHNPSGVLQDWNPRVGCGAV